MTDDSDPTGKQHVLIVGGGIAGLAAALRTRKLNQACRITVVDAAARFGGKIDGDMVAGCVVDGGADVCIGTKLRSTQLFHDLSLAARVITVNPAGLPTYEERDGALRPLPAVFGEELLTFHEGMRELTDAACGALDNVTAVTNSSIESIEASGSRWKAATDKGLSYLADSVIVATPAASASRLLSGIAPDQAAALCALEYPPTTTVTIAWHATDVARPLDGTGYLVTDPTSPVSACTWTSSKNPSHAAAGIVLLRGYVRGTSCDATALVLRHTENILGVGAAPLFTRSYEWLAGIPLYTAAHEERVRELENTLAETRGIFVAGSAFHGVGVPDCINSGERAAAAAVAFLAHRSCEESV